MNDSSLTIKLGGTAGAHAASLAVLVERAEPGWVIVHGGGSEVADWSRRLGDRADRRSTACGSPIRRHSRSRWRSCAASSTRGWWRPSLPRGVAAIGLCGADGDLLGAERFDPRLGEVGRITRVNGPLLSTLARDGQVPGRGADRARQRHGAAQRERRRGGRSHRRRARRTAAPAHRRAGRPARRQAARDPHRRRGRRHARRRRRHRAACDRSCAPPSPPHAPAVPSQSWMEQIRRPSVPRWTERRLERP